MVADAVGLGVVVVAAGSGFVVADAVVLGDVIGGTPGSEFVSADAAGSRIAFTDAARLEIVVAYAV